MINESIAKLVKYGENAGLVSGLDKIYATNRILEVMQISDYEEPEQIPETPDLEETLNELLDDAAKRGLLEHNSVVYRDLFDTKLMDCLMPRPGEVVKKFEELYAKSPQEATDYFYKLSQDSTTSADTASQRISAGAYRVPTAISISRSTSPNRRRTRRRLRRRS